MGSTCNEWSEVYFDAIFFHDHTMSNIIVDESLDMLL